MFDTHCHLNFSRFKKNVADVIKRAHEAGVIHFVIPGTDFETSQKAIEIAHKYENIYVAVGIHPHHVYEIQRKVQSGERKTDGEYHKIIAQEIEKIEHLLSDKKVVAVGEIGMDRHEYGATKYENYQVDENFLALQKELFSAQVKLAIKYQKSLILHNREAKQDLLAELTKNWAKNLEGRTVLHCCEPDLELLDFAKKHDIYLGVDGDITYYPEKQEFIKAVPLDKLVLETDAPFLLPEPLRTQKKFPNEPANLAMISEFIADLKGIEVAELRRVTSENAFKLFGLPK